MIQIFIILEISGHPDGTWLMYLIEAISNVLKFIYAILVFNNDEIKFCTLLDRNMTNKNLQLT